MPATSNPLTRKLALQWPWTNSSAVVLLFWQSVMLISYDFHKYDSTSSSSNNVISVSPRSQWKLRRHKTQRGICVESGLWFSVLTFATIGFYRDSLSVCARSHVGGCFQYAFNVGLSNRRLSLRDERFCRVVRIVSLTVTGWAEEWQEQTQEYQSHLSLRAVLCAASPRPATV